MTTNEPKTFDPMQPFLAGWLSGAPLKRGPDCMKIVEVFPIMATGFTVTFASGLRLAVKVELLEQPPEPEVRDAK